MAGLMLVIGAIPADAQEAPASGDNNGDAAAKPGNSNPPENALKTGYRLQESDDIALPLVPLVPRSAATEVRNEAMAWYMTGRLFISSPRNEAKKALSAFRKAVQLDPQAIEIYRGLIPLEIAFDNLEAAVQLATKAIQLDPDDFEILQMLARQAAENGQLTEAIKYMEQATKSPRIDKSSPQFIILNRSLGTLYSRTGDRDHAADCYEVIFDAVKSPEKYGMDARGKKALLADTETNYEQIGQVLLDGKRLKLALEAFELAGKASRLGSGNLSYYRARILFLSDKYDEALAELQKYFDAQRISKGRLPYQLLSDIYKKLNRSDELIGKLEAMSESDAQNVALKFFLADRLADVKEFERARALYDAMLRNGGDAAGYAGLARVLREMQKSDELLEALGRGVARGEEALAALEPELQALSKDKPLLNALLDAGRARGKLGQLKYEEAYLLAKFAATLKDADSAGEFYRLAISLNRNGRRPSVLDQLEMAEMFQKLKKHRQAVEVCNEILATRQLNEVGQSMIYNLLAQSLTSLNRTNEALEAISKAIDLADDKAGARFFEAWIYSHARRWDEAINKFNQLMTEFPEKKNVVLLCQFSLSNVYVQKGELRQGEEILEKVLEVYPENAQVNNDLGYLWADQGKNLDKAEKMIRKALSMEPENGAYLDSLGWVLFKLEKYDDALPPLEQATEKSLGGDSTVWDHMGDVLLRAMKVEKAIEAWQTAIDHSDDEGNSDPQLIERIKDKLKQHGATARAKPAEKGAP